MECLVDILLYSISQVLYKIQDISKCRAFLDMVDFSCILFHEDPREPCHNLVDDLEWLVLVMVWGQPCCIC